MGGLPLGSRQAGRQACTYVERGTRPGVGLGVISFTMSSFPKNSDISDPVSFNHKGNALRRSKGILHCGKRFGHFETN
jgi:hypothetical protein